MNTFHKNMHRKKEFFDILKLSKESTTLTCKIQVGNENIWKEIKIVQ